MFSRVPLIVILGATGSGKTKLSLDIAQKYGGEIISADSMQVYKGLDIITAKATKQEQLLAKHHLLDIIDPLTSFSVTEFRNKALQIIDRLIDRKTIPIIVGGTNYYIESILWNILIGTSCDDEKRGQLVMTPLNILMAAVKSISSSQFNISVLKDKFASFNFDCIGDDCSVSSCDLHACLKLIDPVMADRLHPNNRRKIIRALQVVVQEGKCLSDILREQQSTEGGSTLGGPLRYPNTLIFWVQAEQQILDDRLNKRVDKMISDGLLDELMLFHNNYNKQRLKNDSNEPADYTKGIFQSIGFKEFHEYLILSDDAKQSETGQKLLQTGVNDLKLVTRRYARKQNRWIQNRFLGNPQRQVPPLYALDSSDITKWNETVKCPALEIIDCFINNIECKYKPLPVKTKQNSQPTATSTTHFCDICQRTFIGKLQWTDHLKSAKHKRSLKRQHKSS